MARVEAITPHDILVIFRMLSPDHRTEFMKLVAKESNAELFYQQAHSLPDEEYVKLMTSMINKVLVSILPGAINHVISTLKELPEASLTEIEQAVSLKMAQGAEALVKGTEYRTKHEFAKKRNRKSDPKTIKRNVEICDRRRRDSKTWSHGKLASEYGLSEPMIRKILTAEAEWRRQLKNDSTN